MDTNVTGEGNSDKTYTFHDNTTLTIIKDSEDEEKRTVILLIAVTCSLAITELFISAFVWCCMVNPYRNPHNTHRQRNGSE